MAERYIILDTETTGLSPQSGHRIIEVGAIEMIDRQLTGERFHHYINPERDIDAGAQKVHGIGRDFLQDKPVFDDIVEAFIGFVDGAKLIIHNAPFDVGFIEHELTRSRKIKPHIKTVMDYCGVIDTLQLARKKHPGLKNSLDALCKRYKVDNKDRTLHGALMDAELLALVYLAMTGGQNQLFDKGPPKHSETRVVKEKIVRRVAKQPLRVISATEEEWQAHKGFLAYMEKQSGVAPLWDQKDINSENAL